MNPYSTTPEQIPVSHFLKRGTLLGAALGLLVGLVYLTAWSADSSELASIVVWRNCILVGAGIGLGLGGAAGWWYRSFHADNPEQVRPETSPIPKRKP